MGGNAIEVTMDEAPLKAAMRNFSERILIYSLIVSVIVATLAALAMHRMILAPVGRLTASIMDFGADPGDRGRIIVPSDKAHEIGQAERALAVMQEALVLELSQKKNLANLGLAVAKISHDMRNMLASAQILSDRLANVRDPLAQRLAPKLVATLDRAIRFCQSTLTYGRAVDDPPRLRTVGLRAIADEAAETVAPEAHANVQIENKVPADLEVTADAEQMFRILLNLLRNGVEALERAGASPGRLPIVSIRAWKEGAMTIIEVADTGPGIPVGMRPKIFSAFQNSTQPGGTGLGLAIAADLIRAHGGTIALQGASDETGARFRLALPQRAGLR
jgi:signal transduction histidine kinase